MPVVDVLAPWKSAEARAGNGSLDRLLAELIRNGLEVGLYARLCDRHYLKHE